jgi:hypothetical protein
MKIDSTKFPNAARYVESLPQGFESFPECEVNAEAVEPFLRFGHLADTPGMPRVAAALLSGTVSDKGWVSEVVFQTANLVVRDLAFANDAAFFQFTYDSSREVFDKPVVRHLMRLVSPTLVVAGATKRWATFHRGSELKASPITESGGRVHTAAVLRYPEGVFSRIFLKGLEQAFLAALSGARGKDARVELAGVRPGTAEYRISYVA